MNKELNIGKEDVELYIKISTKNQTQHDDRSILSNF